MDPVVHFEMPAEDRERMARFYESVFGWQTQMFGPEMGSYTMVVTTESEDGRPKSPGAINGGFFIRGTDADTQVPSVVIAVEDINKAIADVEKAGGKVLGEPNEIPGVGMYSGFRDTEGNRVSLLQPLQRN